MGNKPSAAWQQAYKEIAATPLSEIKGDLYQAVKKRSEEIEASTSQSSAPVVGDDLESKYNVLRNLLQRSWREVHIDTKKYQLTLTVTPEYLERIESALTWRG